MNCHVLFKRETENKSCMRIDDSGQERVCMRVFSTVMCCSNENRSYMRVDES